MQTSAKTEQQKAADTEVVGYIRDNFYRDGFNTVLLSMAMVVAAIGLLIILSLYFFLHQVLPITFPVYPDWRIQPDVPLDSPYLHAADLLQWTSEKVPTVLNFDFMNYEQDIKKSAPLFTTNGWPKYLELVNTFMGSDEVLQNKDFVKTTPLGAPIVLNQGIVEGKYGWWVQIPVEVRYSGVSGVSHTTKLIIQTLIVRISTLNNLDGVAIENIIAKKS